MKADRVRKVADLANRRTRERFGRFLIEGPQSVREAVTWIPDAVRDLYVQAVDGPDGPRIAGETLTSTSSDPRNTVYMCIRRARR